LLVLETVANLKGKKVNNPLLSGTKLDQSVGSQYKNKILRISGYLLGRDVFSC